MIHFKMMEICTDILTQMNEDDEFKYFIENTDKDIFVAVKVENSQRHITNSYSLVTIKCQVHGLPFDTFTTIKNNFSLLEEDKNPLYLKAKELGLIAGICLACSKVMEVYEQNLATGLPMLDDMKGHAGMKDYVEKDYMVVSM